MPPAPTRGNFKSNAQRERLATAADILERLGKSDVAIVDARSEAENQGTLVAVPAGRPHSGGGSPVNGRTT